MTSKSAGVLYKPFGIVGGIVAGKIASAAFTKVWARTRYDGIAPTPRSADATTGQAVLAAVLQGRDLQRHVCGVSAVVGGGLRALGRRVA